jgi:hypothetical protein
MCAKLSTNSTHEVLGLFAAELPFDPQAQWRAMAYFKRTAVHLVGAVEHGIAGIRLEPGRAQNHRRGAKPVGRRTSAAANRSVRERARPLWLPLGEGEPDFDIVTGCV